MLQLLFQVPIASCLGSADLSIKLVHDSQRDFLAMAAKLLPCRLEVDILTLVSFCGFVASESIHNFGRTSDLVHTTAMFKLLAADSSHSRGTWRERTENRDDLSD